jgi:uncharacterized protein (UPF0218 family)
LHIDRFYKFGVNPSSDIVAKKTKRKTIQHKTKRHARFSIVSEHLEQEKRKRKRKRTKDI